MKWLSVKKYKPFSQMTVFVLDSNGGLHLGQWIWCDQEWFCEDRDMENMTITHFCIPDPVEIEEEK
jgi:hypothetical protein